MYGYKVPDVANKLINQAPFINNFLETLRVAEMFNVHREVIDISQCVYVAPMHHTMFCL